ncbi:hypothetical protein C7999DRAFT_18188 [Corynascus novoguineensis]|uniref:Uncharacterized protein n=1 Tax=Corynascus novoguineensis TaxID=1126955 RepID=A0AAN7HII3_9PEZI|nr:hypothetical protein C7999DRAFT_18188 [Corynascus novoguineensis]
MPYNVFTFLTNGCQAVELFGQTRPLDGEKTPDYQYGPGFRFAHDFAGRETNDTATRCHLELRTLWPSVRNLSGQIQVAELSLQFHAEHLALDGILYDMLSDRKRQRPELPGILLNRARASIRGHRARHWKQLPGYRDTRDCQLLLIHRVSSALLSIVNTDDAPYTAIVLTDKGENLIKQDPYLARGDIYSTSDRVFPDRYTAQAKGLCQAGRCTGLNQFLLIALVIFDCWEDDWLHLIRSLDEVANFSLEDTLWDESLDAVMFDESFRISRIYFAIIQVLRVASNMVDDVVRQWTNLRDKWDAVVPRSGMFDADDLVVAEHNWDVITASLKSKAERVQSQISRKNEAVISLRYGLFNATSLRESSKGIALNRAVYVFTVVTVLYTPLGFLATFWAMPMFNYSSESSDETVATSSLPNGFTATFIAVPLLTYILSTIVVWTMGLNSVERLRMKKAFSHVSDVLVWPFEIVRKAWYKVQFRM